MIVVREITVNNAGDREELKTTIVCKQVLVLESKAIAGWPTTEWEWANVASGGTATRMGAGEPKLFEELLGYGKYTHDETVTFLATITGSTTFVVLEIP